MATSGIHIMITKVSKEMATTFGRNVWKLNPLCQHKLIDRRY
jgi:hypothetical protein